LLAEEQEVAPIIVLNKKDLLDEKGETNPGFKQECLERAEYYRQLGYPVISLQANTERAEDAAGVEFVRDSLKGKITMLSGHSGVGKSSIINKFAPEIVQDVEPDSNIFYK